MSVSMSTALIIQSWEDTNSIENDGIYITTTEQDNCWAGFVHLVKGGTLHSLLLSTTPIFESKEAAENALTEVIAQVRETATG